MPFSIKKLAELIDAKTLGDDNLQIHTLTPISQPEKDSIAPLFQKKYLSFKDGFPAAVLAEHKQALEAIDKGVRAAIVHETPVVALARLIDVFFPPKTQVGFIHPSAIIDSSVQIHETAWIGPGVVVEENVKIGEGSWIGPNAVICRGAILGSFVKIGPGAVIGYEGFGFFPTEKGPQKLRQIGHVELQDFVEIGANTCVDRGTLGKTIIGNNSKLDNLVQIGHNVRVGDDVLVAAQVGLAGSVIVGDNVMIGGQVGVADHLSIGNKAKVTAQSGVTRDISPDVIVSGSPAISREIWLRSLASLIAASRHK